MSELTQVHRRENINENMEADVLNSPEELEIKEVPTPIPGPSEVLVHVKCTTICGTDIEIIKGSHLPRWPTKFPAILGHEWSGEIVALGPMTEASNFNLGDHVATQKITRPDAIMFIRFFREEMGCRASFIFIY